LKDIAKIVPDLAYAASAVEGISTGGQPSAEHFETLAAEGYRTVIDLRTGDEDRGLPGGLSEEQVVREAGMEYVSLPLASRAGDYVNEAFDGFRQALSEPSRRPVLVHCRTATRVEPLMLAYLVLDEGRELGEALSLVEEISARKEELHGCALEYIRARSAG